MNWADPWIGTCRWLVWGEGSRLLLGCVILKENP